MTLTYVFLYSAIVLGRISQKQKWFLKMRLRKSSTLETSEKCFGAQLYTTLTLQNWTPCFGTFTVHLNEFSGLGLSIH